MTDCKILKNFRFSRDGIISIDAQSGETMDIPDNMIKGLSDAGYITDGLEVKMMPPPENKMADPPGNKEELASLRAEYHEAFGKKPFMGWNAAKLIKKLANQ